ncbi:MAG: tRNA pseudouridine(38-40) synthase TruA [Acidimicrobiia bacterium]
MSEAPSGVAWRAQPESAPPTNTLKLVIAYDGTAFRGFATQIGQRTIEGELTAAFDKILPTSAAPLGLRCAGRTDAGVHAWGQVVSVKIPAEAEPERVRRALNGILAPEIVVRRCQRVDASFDARRSATWRRYQYTIVNRPEPDPFLARYAWWLPDPLDVSRLRLAADPFVGEHDFASFCRRGPEGSTTVRRVLDSHWLDDDGSGVLTYEIRATAFCWQMVRAIVGTMIDAATDKLRPGDIMNILRANNRQAAGRIAPPQGLSLQQVGY